MSNTIPYVAAAFLLVLITALGAFVVRTLRTGEATSAEAPQAEREARSAGIAVPICTSKLCNVS